MKRSILAATALLVLSTAEIAQAAGKFTAADYKRALWMATRFYGGQRSGVGPNWLQMDTQYPQNFVKDAYNGTDVSGGWFDCGDHVMYGQTQYWSAYTLAKAYEQFPQGFDDIYDGEKYADYKASGNWDMSGGKPNGIPDLIDELIYEADFIAKAAISPTAFVAKKGVGGMDHVLWVTPGYQSVRYKSNAGGESDGSRPITVDMGDGSMASNAAATLAVMSRILTRLNIYPEKSKNYAAKALVAYAYAGANRKTVGVSDGAGGVYPANASFNDDFATASLELFSLTSDSTYLKTALGLASGIKWGNNGLCYNDNEPQALYNLYEIGGVASALGQLTGASGMMNRYTSNVNTEGLSKVGDGWGALRYPLNGAYLGGLINRISNSDTYDQFIYNQVDFVMGANVAQRSFITGFCSGCKEQPVYPHHRGIYLVNDSIWEKYNKTKSKSADGLSIPARNKFHGSLLGGGSNRTSTGFTENIDEATTNEVCTDYNVGLVGALGYIVSKLAPVDTSKFGSASILPGSRSVGKLSLRQRGTNFTFEAPAGQKFSQVTVLDASGRKVWASTENRSEVNWNGETKPGLYLAHAVSGTQLLSTSVVVP